MGLISRVSSRTYRKRQKTKKITSNPTKMAQEAAVQARPISKKHLFVRDGMFKAELDEFFKRELAEDGYSGVIVRKSKTCEVIIIATRGLSAVAQAESLRYKLLGGLAVRR